MPLEVPVSDNEMQLVRDALNLLLGRRLVEAGRYVDGAPDGFVVDSDDSVLMDVPGFCEVLGERLIAAVPRTDETLSLDFSGGYRVEFQADADVPEGVERWSITVPSLVTMLRGHEVVQES
jgi:hypothetical protein